MRQTVFIALLHTLPVLPFFDHERSQAPASTGPSTVTESGSLVGRFLQFRRQISRNPSPALSFRPWPFSYGRGANLQTRYAPRFALSSFPTIPHPPTLTRHSARRPAPPSANRKPRKPCFLVGCWRAPALSPPVLKYRQEGPLSPGRVAASRSGQHQHSSEVSIPNAHPLFREETPGSRECFDFIGF